MTQPSLPVPAFGFETSARMIFGRGTAGQAAGEVVKFGQRVLLVHGASIVRSAWLRQDLVGKMAEVTGFCCPREPDLELLDAAVTVARNSRVEVVVAIGGGAVIDLGKAVAALSVVSGAPLDYLEVVGNGRKLERQPLPFVAIPTTSGTGAEVTKNAVIGVPSHCRKVSLRDSRMLADLALIDPGLTDSSPRAVTLASGLDAITQVIEPYICTRASPMTDALCRDAIPRGLKALARLMVQEDKASRDDMAVVSLFGGMALANSGLGAVHGLAGVIGGMAPAPHGAICGALLPHVLAVNGSEPSAASERIREVQNLICDTLDLTSPSGFDGWIRAQGLPGLSAMGIAESDYHSISEAACMSSSMAANPRDLSCVDLCKVLRAAT